MGDSTFFEPPAEFQHLWSQWQSRLLKSSSRTNLNLSNVTGRKSSTKMVTFYPAAGCLRSRTRFFSLRPSRKTRTPSSSSTTIVHTFARNQDGESICHDKHPFVACVHLLRAAPDSSIAHISVPYLSDLHFIDELCHYAKPIDQGGKDLTIRIVLGPDQWVKDRLHNYVNNPIQETGRQERESALRRLAIREWGTSRRFSHSNAMVSAAGAMVGSYNYTYAARYYHYEEGVFLSSNHPELASLRNRIEELWRVSRPIVTLARRPPPGYVAPAGDAKRAKIG